MRDEYNIIILRGNGNIVLPLAARTTRQRAHSLAQELSLACPYVVTVMEGGQGIGSWYMGKVA